MKLDVIENRGPDNLRDTLTDLLKRSTDVRIAVAFVTTSGLNAVLGPLQGVAGRGSVRIVVGLYQCVTEPQALRALLRLQQLSKGKFSVRLSREPGFHRKVYLLQGRSTLNAVIGSSNLTKEGLISGGELNTLSSMNTTEAPARRITRIFEEEWSAQRSVPLTKARIEAYVARRGRAKTSGVLSKQELRTVLGASPRHESAGDPPATIALWRTAIQSFVEASTAEWVSQETDWDRRRLEWFNMRETPRFGLKDRLVVFDHPDNAVYLAEVQGTARTSVRCSDGRHFVAYRRLPNARRRLTAKMWSELRELGITKTLARDDKKLSESQWLEIKRLVVRR
jgi:HKD family nuclease